MKKYFIITSLLLSTIAAELIKPENGETLNYRYILFEWNQLPDAIEYNLQASEQSNFNNLLLDVNEESTVYIDDENFDWNDSYYWRVRPIYEDEVFGDWIQTSSFSVGGILYSPLDVDIYQDDLIQDGYVAIGGFAPEMESVIIDKYGNEIWNDGGFQFLLNHINEYGNIYGFSSTEYPLHSGMKGNMDMDVVWSTMDPNPENQVDTHEIKQLPNGNYMAFLRENAYGPIPSDNYMTQYFQMLGYQADGVTPEFLWYGQKIVEWNEDHEVVWTWSPFDHFTMQDYDNYEGTWYNAYFNQEVDWMHSNAFHFDEEESVIYVSHRHLSRISKIAYPSGDVIWNMGLPSEYMHSGDEHICTDLLFSFQHNIQLLDDGDLLFFDNGNLSDMLMDDSNPTSRIRRIRVIDNSYCETVWQYDLPQNLQGLGMGSVQLLDNGNYSIYTFGSGFGPECSVLEVTPDQEMVWKATGNSNTAWYRSYKVPSLHPEAFSVLVNDFKEIEGEAVVEISNNQFDFTIHNKSGYSLPYHYIFTDLMDGATPLFSYAEGSVNLGPYETVDLSFGTISSSSSTDIFLSVWPERHEYALKELFFTVILENSLLGDINMDGALNVLDVVLLVDLALNNNYNQIADMNSDGAINVLDVVLLVGVILN